MQPCCSFPGMRNSSVNGPGMQQEDEAWQDFALSEGTLDDFLITADGDLCGPQPNRAIYGAPMTTGQVLPSTHTFDNGEEGQDQESNEHISIGLVPEGEGDNQSVAVHLTNGELQSMMSHLDHANGHAVDLG